MSDEIKEYMENAKKILDTQTLKYVYVKTGPSGLSATDVRNTFIIEDGYYRTYKGIHKIDFAGNANFIFSGAKVIKHEGIIEEDFTTKTLMSDDPKIFWWANIGLYNSIFEGFSHLLETIKTRTDNPIVIINDNCMGPEKDFAYFKFLLKSLEDIGIRYEIYNNKDIVYANNFSIIDKFCVRPDMISAVKNHFHKYVKDKSIKPFRKVYLSRRHILERNYNWIKDGLSFSSDHRLYDHEELENFLEKNGFEIIVPEQTFLNFEDQINYMYEVETLASLSSSGIANSLFMQPGTSVVEFITTYPMSLGNPDFDNVEEKSIHGVEAIHHLYHTMSYVNDTCYFALPNYERSSKGIIDKINNNKNLRKIIVGEV